MIMFRDLEVEDIQCGLHHVVVKCEGGKFYLQGNYDYNQCLVFDGVIDVEEPTLVEMKGREIKDIVVGVDNTAVIASTE